MGHEGISREVQEAQKKGNHRALSAMGQAGGRKAAENRLLRKARQTLDMEERVAELARNESLSPEGDDVLPAADTNPADQITYPHH